MRFYHYRKGNANRARLVVRVRINQPACAGWLKGERNGLLGNNPYLSDLGSADRRVTGIFPFRDAARHAGHLFETGLL